MSAIFFRFDLLFLIPLQQKNQVFRKRYMMTALA